MAKRPKAKTPSSKDVGFDKTQRPEKTPEQIRHELWLAERKAKGKPVP